MWGIGVLGLHPFDLLWYMGSAAARQMLTFLRSLFVKFGDAGCGDYRRV